MKPANFCVDKKPPNQTKNSVHEPRHRIRCFGSIFQNIYLTLFDPVILTMTHPNHAHQLATHVKHQGFLVATQHSHAGQDTNNLQWNLELCQAGQSLKHTTTKAHEHQKNILANLTPHLMNDAYDKHPITSMDNQTPGTTVYVTVGKALITKKDG